MWVAERRSVRWRRIASLCSPSTPTPRDNISPSPSAWAETSTQTLRLKFSCALTFVQRFLLFPEALKKKHKRFPIFIPPYCLVLQTAAPFTESAARWSLLWQDLPNRLRLENTAEHLKALKVEKALSDICLPLIGLFDH